jgi:outer membrane protein OmpA-like peptidoglycan-associated protein
MFQRIAAALIVVGLVTAAAFSPPSAEAAAGGQTAPNPTQQTIVTPQGEMPIFRVTVVGRTIPAINYRPRSGDTRINFAGTALMPKAEGWASIEGERGYIKIDARFDELGAPMQFGREYLTYVLWAITPEGRATNLGELQVNGNDGKLEVTTELQSFALLVTAEPYFAVSQPSDVVVIENVVRESGFERTQGRVETLEAKFELLKRGSYLMNQSPSALKVKPLEPGAPLDLAQARNAVELARIAGADKYAPDTYAKAQQLLNEAEAQRERRRSGNQVQQPARQAAQTAEDARLISLQRQEAEFQAEQKRLAAQREADANARARAEEDRRRQAEARADADRAAAEAARLAAERERAQADAARTAQQAAADAARLAAERERAAVDQARLEAERARAEAARIAAEADASRAAAEAARAAAEAQAQQARQLAEQSEREKAELRERLRQQLNVILETRETARGLIVNLSDVLFDVDKAELKSGAREKLARIAGILSAHPDLKMEIEGHTDSTGSDEYNQSLSERRAASVRTYLNQQGIGQAIVATAGYGESRPVATNGTAAGRQQNRRVELIVSGESIGRAQ